MTFKDRLKAVFKKDEQEKSEENEGPSKIVEYDDGTTKIVPIEKE